MGKRNLFKISIPAILLTATVGLIAFFGPIVENQDPDSIIAQVQTSPRGNFLGDELQIKLNVRYPRNAISIDPQKVIASFDPFFARGEPRIETRPGEITIYWRVQCVSCFPGNSYSLPDIHVPYKELGADKDLVVKQEPIFVSQQIDPKVKTEDVVMRRPNEPIVLSRLEFWAGILLLGLLLIGTGVFALRRMWRGEQTSDVKQTAEPLVYENELLRKLDLLRSKLSAPGVNHRKILAACAGLLEDESRKAEYDHEQRSLLNKLRWRAERVAFQETLPQKGDVLAILDEFCRIINHDNGKEDVK